MTFEPQLEWQKQAINELLNTSLSVAEIAAKHKRSRATIITLMRRAGISRTTQAPTGLRPVEELSPLSPVHKSIGIRISLYPDRNELRDKLGIGFRRFKQMEMGVHDFTLSELYQLKEALQLTIEDLVAPSKVLKAYQ